MGRSSRRTFFQSVAASSLLLAAPLVRSARAQQAEYVLKFGNNNPATHPMIVAMKEAAERITQESDGKVELQLFPNSQLGSDTDMLSQVRSGALEMFALSALERSLEQRSPWIVARWLPTLISTARLPTASTLLAIAISHSN